MSVGPLSGRRLGAAGLLTVGFLASACIGAEQPRETARSATAEPTTVTGPGPAPTPMPKRVPEGRALLVTSADDDGPGTLRQLLVGAQPGDLVTFDPAAFPPGAPKRIVVESALPQIVESYLTIDASDAGVILDGSRLPKDSWIPGLEVLSDHNRIRGLQVVSFTGTGIAVAGGRNNTIGGDRTVGRGRIGQGNLTTGNDVGIGVWDPRATGNLVTGNLIGVNADGAPGSGNRNSGVWVTEGATGNVIGPDNVIALSGRCGVEVDGSSTVRNTITRNSIRNSGHRAVCLLLGSNAGLPAPLINDLDLSDGQVTGTACAGCSVEVFSDDGDEGATYEGQATADAHGVFTFHKRGAFAHPSITMTATDIEGNTSQLSQLVATLTDIPALQEANRLPKFRSVARASSDLHDNRMAAGQRALPLEVVQTHQQLRDYLLDLGIKRIDTLLNEVEPPIDWETSEHDIPPEFDQLIDDMVGSGVAVNYLLHFWDKEGHGRGEVLSTPRFKSAEQVAEFIDYVRFVVRHFKGRVQYYTIWSEPDACGQEGIKCIEAADYIALAREVIPVIRHEDPQAKVAVAPVVLYFERDFLPAVMSSDVAPLFDVIQWHGQYDVRPDNEFYGTYYYDYPSIVEEIREVAIENGFQGEYWSTDMQWESEQFPHEVTGEQPWVVNRGTDKVAAKHYARGIVMHLGMEVSAGMEAGQPPAETPWSHQTVRLLSTVMAGAMPSDLSVSISGAPEDSRIVSHGFALPDGDMLFALWNDGTAVDDDPGVSVTLTFQGLSPRSATGLDVLYGFEQELITDPDSDDLVISAVLVKDYPTILRIHPN